METNNLLAGVNCLPELLSLDIEIVTMNLDMKLVVDVMFHFLVVFILRCLLEVPGGEKLLHQEL